MHKCKLYNIPQQSRWLPAKILQTKYRLICHIVGLSCVGNVPDGLWPQGLCFSVSFWGEHYLKIPYFCLDSKFFSQELGHWQSCRNKSYLISFFYQLIVEVKVLNICFILFNLDFEDSFYTHQQIIAQDNVSQDILFLKIIFLKY